MLRRERAFSLVNTRWVIRSEVGLMYLDLCRSVLFLVRSSDPTPHPPKSMRSSKMHASVGGTCGMFGHCMTICEVLALCGPKCDILRFSKVRNHGVGCSRDFCVAPVYTARRWPSFYRWLPFGPRHGQEKLKQHAAVAAAAACHLAADCRSAEPWPLLRRIHLRLYHLDAGSR